MGRNVAGERFGIIHAYDFSADRRRGTLQRERDKQATGRAISNTTLQGNIFILQLCNQYLIISLSSSVIFYLALQSWLIFHLLQIHSLLERMVSKVWTIVQSTLELSLPNSTSWFFLHANGQLSWLCRHSVKEWGTSYYWTWMVASRKVNKPYKTVL